MDTRDLNKLDSQNFSSSVERLGYQPDERSDCTEPADLDLRNKKELLNWKFLDGKSHSFVLSVTQSRAYPVSLGVGTYSMNFSLTDSSAKRFKTCIVIVFLWLYCCYLTGGHRLARYIPKIPHVGQLKVVSSVSEDELAYMEFGARLAGIAKQIQTEFVYAKQKFDLLQQEQDLV